MLGKTAGGLFWMFRSLERAENTARLIEAGFRIALTGANDPSLEWQSVVLTTGTSPAYGAKYDVFEAEHVIDFLLRDRDNPNSVMSVIRQARDNAKTVRTALTSEVWVAVNDTWMVLNETLANPVSIKDLPAVLAAIKHQSALVRGALYGTMMRNDIYDFCRLGTYIERFDNTARIIDVKYYTLLPDYAGVGDALDNTQWEMLLRSVSAHRAFRWTEADDMNAAAITRFLMLDKRMPRSLAYCASQLVENLTYLEKEHPNPIASIKQAKDLEARVSQQDIGLIYKEGLHEFLESVLKQVAALCVTIENDFRFNPPAIVGSLLAPSEMNEPHLEQIQSGQA